jgi:hypothetical protein
MDSFLQEGSPSSMSSFGSDDAAYSSDTVATDYMPLHQLSQHHAVEHQALPTHLQRRASLSSTPVSAATGLGILGGFVGEGPAQGGHGREGRVVVDERAREGVASLLLLHILSASRQAAPAHGLDLFRHFRVRR